MPLRLIHAEPITPGKIDRHDVARGMGVHLGPAERATIRAAPGATVEPFHLVGPQVPK
ncbi:MAG: hypothetical protein HYX77_06705 [Acidobacteria bacterium]|nr:hypothetical protein [Acidobacteriota bacterium]